MKISDVPPFVEYIDLVRNGPYPSCKEQFALCEMLERIFETEDIFFDESQFNRYMGLQKYFPFKLFEWEKFIFAAHNCLYKPNKQLRFPELVSGCGRGTGKNGYITYESTAVTTKINGVKNYDVDIFANSEDQAKCSPDQIREILEEAKLQRAFSWNKEVITNNSTHSRIRYHTSRAASQDGQRPGYVIFDEYHAYENYDLITVAETGLGKTDLPRKGIFTTDGNVRDGPLDKLKDVCHDILFKGLDDLGTFPFICKLDSFDEIDDEINWHKANPSLRYRESLLEETRREYRAWKRDPSNTDFVTKRMNIPPMVTVSDITSWENITAASRPLPELIGRDCVAGIDYAKTTDMVSAGLLFNFDDVYFWFQHSWVCKKSPALKRIKAPLGEWERKGLLTFVDALEIPPEFPVRWLLEQSRKYNITKLGMDNFRITLFRKALIAAGFNVDDKNRVMLYKRVTEMRYAPVIISAFNNQRIIFGDDPMMRWFTNNAYQDIDKDGNITFAKKDPKARMTDGFKALAAAFGASADLSVSAPAVNLNDVYIFDI